MNPVNESHIRLSRTTSMMRCARPFLAALLMMTMALVVFPQRRRREPPPPGRTVEPVKSSIARPSVSTVSINENTLRANIKYLSDDLLEGRGPGARGGELAAKYIAAQLE